MKKSIFYWWQVCLLFTCWTSLSKYGKKVYFVETMTWKLGITQKHMKNVIHLRLWDAERFWEFNKTYSTHNNVVVVASVMYVIGDWGNEAQKTREKCCNNTWECIAWKILCGLEKFCWQQRFSIVFHRSIIKTFNNSRIAVEREYLLVINYSIM